jgi:membrane dipeptidase
MTFPVFDGHNDVLLRLHFAAGGRDFLEESAEGHVDLPRARRGGFAGGLFAVFVPGERTEEPAGLTPPYSLPLSPPVDSETARRAAEAQVALLFQLETRANGALRVVRSAAELDRCLADDVIGAVVHFEGAEPVGTVDDLELWHERGLRSLGLVWSRPNAYAEGVAFRFPGSPDSGAGLTGAGRDLVRECNRLGILVDVSHVNLRGFFDVAAISDAPLVASHSNAHALCPSTRNLTDEQLDAIAGSGGIVGVTYSVGLLRDDGRIDPETPLETVVRHVDYLVERMGIDHVGFGSDFDGARVPAAIGDVAGVPALVDALAERGYEERALRKLAYENWVRVLRETWARGGV